MKGKARERLLWVVMGALAVAFLGERFLLSGVRTRNRTLRQQITAEEVKLRTSIGMQKRKAAILSDQRKYADYFLFPADDRERIAAFLKETERIAQESGAAIVDLIPDNQPSKVAGQTRYAAQLKVEASMAQFLTLLHHLQDSRFLIKVDRFSLTPKDEQASSLRVDTTISLVVP